MKHQQVHLVDLQVVRPKKLFHRQGLPRLVLQVAVLQAALQVAVPQAVVLRVAVLQVVLQLVLQAVLPPKLLRQQDLQMVRRALHLVLQVVLLLQPQLLRKNLRGQAERALFSQKCLQRWNVFER
jgi:hypothetical protein